MRALRALLILAVTALLPGCFRQERVAGGWADTETGHKVAGIVTRADGAPAVGALVILRPVDYLGRDPSGGDTVGIAPTGGTLLDLTCDSSGRFAIDSVIPGRYALETRYQEIHAALARFEMPKEPGRIQLNGLRVKPVGSITGRVRFSDGVPGPALVRIRGLERAALADKATGVFTFGNVPEGEYTLRFEGLEPGVTPAEKPGVEFAAGSGANTGEITLQRGLRQGFSIEDGALALAGVDSTNPVVLENGSFRSPMDGAYLFAKASVGRLDLRGVIASYGRDTGAAAIAANVRACARQIDLARQSGMALGLVPVGGARKPIALPRDGNLWEADPGTSDGADLLIREALKAAPDRPLVLICGTNLTTAAQALLKEPRIADRMVVFGANNGNINADDSLAAEVVARKGRFIAWSREHYWPTDLTPTHVPDRIPGRFGDALRALYAPVAPTPTWAYSYFGDFGPATWLYRRAVWKTAVPSLYAGPPLEAAPTAEPVYDFVDIPLAANDWDAMMDEFYAAVEDPAAYRPWTFPGAIEGEAYAAVFHAAVDSIAGGEALTLKDNAAWAEWSVQADSAGTFAVDLRYRADSAAALAITIDPGPPSSQPIAVPLPAAKDWATVTATLPVPAGRHRLRIAATKGPASLDRFQVR